MAIKKVIEHPAKVLSTPCAEVTEINEDIITLLDDLYDTMVEYDGVGIAAPQINVGLCGDCRAWRGKRYFRDD